MVSDSLIGKLVDFMEGHDELTAAVQEQIIAIVRQHDFQSEIPDAEDYAEVERAYKQMADANTELSRQWFDMKTENERLRARKPVSSEVRSMAWFILGRTPDKNTQSEDEVEETLESLQAIARKYAD